MQEPLRRRRTSKNDSLIRAFEEAGTVGLNMDDLERIAQSAGVNSDRHALRAYCWHQKKAGHLISLAPGRYAIAPPSAASVDGPAKDSPEVQREGATAKNSQGETAAPTRSANNQHREGDAGGGI